MPYLDPIKKRLYKQQWNKRFYANNKQSEKARILKRKLKLRKWLDEYKSKLACERCDERHIACLDFHHRDRNKKDFTLGDARANGWGTERMLLEMKKCMVLCSNCHRKLHAKMAKNH